MADLNIKIPAIEKLIEVTASGIGAVAGPVVDRLTANMRAETRRIEATGEADARRIEAKSEADAIAINAGGHMNAIQQIGEAHDKARQPVVEEMSIAYEIESRLVFQERKRQSNIYNVVSMAAEELDGKEVRDHEVDHDWTARFFDHVQDVTSKQMQWIWARILSGEVETPGRTSLHALSILRNMNQRDAKLFANVARFVIGDFVFNDDEYVSKIDDFPNLSTILHLSSHGLMSTGAGLQRHFSFMDMIGSKHRTAVIHGETIFVMLATTNKTFMLPTYLLTPSGKQLYDNLGATIDESYLHVFSKYLKEKAGVELAMAPIIERSSDHFRHGPLIDVLSGQPYQVS